MRQFKALLREHIAAVQSDSLPMPTNLGPPLFFQDAIKQLRVIVSTYETSLSASAGEHEEVDRLLAEAFDPFMLICEEMAKPLSPPDDSIFLINCWLMGSKCLGQKDLTRHKEALLGQRIDGRCQQLTSQQLDFLRQESGLGELISALDLPATQRDSMITASSLESSSQKLDNFLPSAHMDAMERLGKLQDTSLARKITETAANLFCREFERLETYVDSGEDSGVGQESTFRSVFPRTTGEIRVSGLTTQGCSQ